MMYKPHITSLASSLEVPEGILGLQAAYDCSNCSTCHWDNITAFYNAKFPWLDISSWAVFLPFKEGSGCFKEAASHGKYTQNYTGKFTLRVNTGRPMQRLIKTVLDNFPKIPGISPLPGGVAWYDPTPMPNPEPGILTALDVQPFSSVTNTSDPPRPGVFHYVIVERGSPDWMLLEQIYPAMSQECNKMSKEVQVCTMSKACCGSWNTTSNRPESSCVEFKETQAECEKYVSDFEINPKELCVPVSCNDSVPLYAYKKEYDYKQIVPEPLWQRWKEAEEPANRMLFKDMLNLPTLEEPKYARGVCTNRYFGFLNTTEDRIHEVQCGYGACWLTGKYHNVWDPPGAPLSQVEDLSSMEPQLSCLEQQGKGAWAISNVGSILSFMRAGAFVAMIIYGSMNVTREVLATAQQQRELSRSQQESFKGPWGQEVSSAGVTPGDDADEGDQARCRRGVGSESLIQRSRAGEV
jgi:hypothetical protein